MPRKKVYSRTGYSVYLREKQLRDGRTSLYLDIYSEGKRRYEFLKLYKRAGTDKSTKDYNRAIEVAAEKIRSEMLVNFANGEAGISKQRMYRNMGVIETLDTFIAEKEKNGIKAKGYRVVRKQLEEYGQKATLKDMDKGWMVGFIEHLKEVRKTNGEKLSAESGKCYLNYISAFLRWCVRKELISESPMDKLGKEEKIRGDRKSHREYLEEEELKSLMRTECSNDEVKKAFMFSVLTGLRVSDVMNLRWSDLKEKDRAMTAEIVMRKTGKPIEVTITDMARKWMPEREGEGRVFRLPTLMSICNILGRWTKAAGIKKKITFHCARHTFATTCLSAGIDIYTVSKLLGHSEVRTTQIYAEVVGRKKREAALRLSEHFKEVLGD